MGKALILHGRDHRENGPDPTFHPVVVERKVIDDLSEITTGDGKLQWAISDDLNGWYLVKAHAFITTVSTSGNVIVQIRNRSQSVDMLSTRISIDQGEFTSYTASAQPVVNTANRTVSTGDLIAVDVDSAGTVAMGLGVILTFRSPKG